MSSTFNRLTPIFESVSSTYSKASEFSLGMCVAFLSQVYYFSRLSSLNFICFLADLWTIEIQDTLVNVSYQTSQFAIITKYVYELVK